MNKRKMKEGQSLFEVVVAIAISALVITAIVAVATNSIRNSTYSKNLSIASDFSQQLVEWLREQRDSDIQQFLSYVDSDLPGSSTTWCFPVLSWLSPSRATYGLKTVAGTICDGSSSSDGISGTQFFREASFTMTHPVSPTNPSTTLNVVQADIVVFWKDAQGDHKVINATNFSDWRQR